MGLLRTRKLKSAAHRTKAYFCVQWSKLEHFAKRKLEDICIAAPIKNWDTRLWSQSASLQYTNRDYGSDEVSAYDFLYGSKSAILN